MINFTIKHLFFDIFKLALRQIIENKMIFKAAEY